MVAEWDGPAAFPPPTALRVGWGFEGHRSTSNVPDENAVAVSTIGIDTGKNTLHLIGLDEQGGIVLREKVLAAEFEAGSRIYRRV